MLRRPKSIKTPLHRKKKEKLPKANREYLSAQLIVLFSVVVVVLLGIAMYALVLSPFYRQTNVWLPVQGLVPFADNQSFLRWLFYG